MAQEEILDYIIDDFRNGMITNVDSTDKDKNAFYEIKNARIDIEDGSLVKRLQSTYYNETSLGSSPIMGGVRFYYGTDSKELIIAYDEFIKKGDDALGTFSNIKTGLTAGNRYSFVPYKDKLYCFNGIDSNLRYDGTTIKTMGCPAPTSIPTLTDPTVFLSHFNGIDASTTIVDTKGQTVTVGGNAQLDTDYYKFGKSSLYLPDSSSYITIPALNGQFGSGDFTVDLQLRLNSLPAASASKILFYQQTDASNYQVLYIYNDAGEYNLIYKVVSSSVELINCSKTLEEISAGTWYHVNVGRKDTSIFLGFHGITEEFTGITDSVPSFTGAFYIGNNTTGVNFDGRIDEGRVTKTMCRFIDNYTVPSEAFTTGVIKYAVTFGYDDEGYQESNPYLDSDSEIIECSIEAGDSVQLSSIPVSADGDCEARKIYRTLKDSDVYYLVDKIEDNTTTSYDDIKQDINLVSEIAIDHDVPPIWKMAVLHKDRIFGFKPNSCEVDFTTIEEYNSMPDVYSSVNGYVMVNENDGSDIVSIASIESGVLVFKRSGVFLINTSAGNSSLNWSVDKIDSRGICAPNSVANISSNKVIALTLDKEAELDLRVFSAVGSTSLGFRIKDILNSINHLYYDEVVGQYCAGRYYLSFTDTYAGLSYNHKIAVMQFTDDFSKFGYCIDDGNISCYIPAFGEGDWGQIYVGMSTQGQVLRIETRTADVIHKTSIDINTGTLNRLEESGSDEYPEFTLDESEFTGLFSNTVISSLSGTIDSYSDDEDDIIWNAGFIESDILYVGANAFNLAFWSSELGDNAGTAIRLRTGDTEAECSTATWSEWFTDPSGSDISGLTAKAYLQYQLLIASGDLPDTETKLYRDDFVVKIACGLGAEFESYINFLIDTGKIDLGYPDRIKRLRSVIVEYENDDSTLNLYLAKNNDSLSLAEAIDTETYENIRQVILPFNYIGEYFRLKLTEQSLLSLKIKSIRLRFSVLPMNAQVLLRGRG